MSSTQEKNKRHPFGDQVKVGERVDDFFAPPLAEDAIAVMDLVQSDASVRFKIQGRLFDFQRNVV